MRLPPVLADVYFDFDWDNRRVWAVAAEVRAIDRGRLVWHLALPLWSTQPPEPRFDLRPRDVLEDPARHPVHAERIRVADLGHPLDVMAWRGPLCILDGIHRLARACLEGRPVLAVRCIPQSAIPQIRRMRG